jgi:hypothetical protein
MSIGIEIIETSAWTSKESMEKNGLTVSQVLASMGETTIDGKRYKITKLMDVETGLEIT